MIYLYNDLFNFKVTWRPVKKKKKNWEHFSCLFSPAFGKPDKDFKRHKCGLCLLPAKFLSKTLLNAISFILQHCVWGRVLESCH